MCKVQSDPPKNDPKGGRGLIGMIFVVHHHFLEKKPSGLIGRIFVCPSRRWWKESCQLPSIGTSETAPWDDGFCLLPAERPELSELIVPDFLFN